MKPPTKFARSLLLHVVVLLSLSLRPAEAANPPGTVEVYGGTVSQLASDGGARAADTRWGSIQLTVEDGTVTGRFTFFAPEDPAAAVTTTNCRGYLDPVTNRGFLKLDQPQPGNGGPAEKVALLLRQGVLTGGTMRANGQVLAFRLELFVVLAP